MSLKEVASQLTGSLNDHALQGDDITMIELSHDGRLLEKLHSVFLTCFFFQCLNCHY